MMNQLETNLTLWAIGSILVFEILIIICLGRCWFNRLRPKKFYVKRDEYEYLPDIHGGSSSKYQSTILRPPHADELAHIGTIGVQDSSHKGLENLGFYPDDKDERIFPVVTRPLSQQWIELQAPMINTVQLPSTENYSYRQPTIIPRPTLISDQFENYRLQSLRRPDIILPQVKRVDTSTEFYGMQYANVMPKSILKTVTSTTSPVDTSYVQLDRMDQSMERRIPLQLRMNFAFISQLNDIQWEIPGEFRTMIQRTPSPISDTRASLSIPLQITERQAFEY